MFSGFVAGQSLAVEWTGRVVGSIQQHALDNLFREVFVTGFHLSLERLGMVQRPVDEQTGAAAVLEWVVVQDHAVLLARQAHPRVDKQRIRTVPGARASQA